MTIIAGSPLLIGIRITRNVAICESGRRQHISNPVFTQGFIRQTYLSSKQEHMRCNHMQSWLVKCDGSFLGTPGSEKAKIHSKKSEKSHTKQASKLGLQG
ncbi:hypothetical protein CSKR_204091 [Clonorchis sinensis]|uniref:Uncharacterized protein n=1 Tax=Clonorchis sinensis TaxID=79923 RepID=A0A8T1M9Q0_CLOSI|nr:hypothetical protein CSKR_204091 [Clonorchis sinensis]